MACLEGQLLLHIHTNAVKRNEITWSLAAICGTLIKIGGTLHEILDMYCISRRLVRDILRHNKIDFYKNEDEIYINQKENGM